MSLRTTSSHYILVGLFFLMILSIVNSSLVDVLAEKSEIDQDTISLEEEILSSSIIAYYQSSQENLTVDGVIDENEYLDDRLESVTGITIYLEHNNTHLFMGLSGPTIGWIAVGFNSQGNGMDNANLIMANVVDGVASVSDRYGKGHDEPILDTASGGTNDIISFNGLEIDGVTTIEFIMPLNSADGFDYPLVVNQSADIYFAYNRFDDLSEEHTDHSELNLKFFIAPEFLEVPEFTSLDITTSKSTMMTNHDNFTLTAKLIDQQSLNPIENESVDFFLKGSYGNLYLGTGITNSNGEATLTTSIENFQLEEISFIIMYRGSLNYRVSDSESTFSFLYIEHGEDFFD
ncbi:MAG: DOMON domain-containing protein, partial [Candidatus Hodarchaeales archaeon]